MQTSRNAPAYVSGSNPVATKNKKTRVNSLIFSKLSDLLGPWQHFSSFFELFSGIGPFLRLVRHAYRGASRPY